MQFNSFIYRQKQRIKYHLASDKVTKQIAEINRFAERIRIQNRQYYIKEINLTIPEKKFDFIFSQFEIFINNALTLGGTYKIYQNNLIFAWDILTVNINTAGELFIINEIYVKKCYQFRFPPQHNISIIDIGMNVALASLFFASLPYVKEVFAFEPFKPTYKLALQNLAFNEELSSKIHPRNYGLGKKEEIMETYFSRSDSGLNNIYGRIQEPQKDEDLETIEIKNACSEINEILEKQSQSEFIIKIDTEGAEYEIMESIFSKRVSEKIIGFMIEWHNDGSDRLEKLLLMENFKIYSLSLSKNTGLIYAIR